MPVVPMPRLSDTMTEGVISQWLKHEGDTVERGEVIAEIETDKATMELEAYDSGVLAHIIAEEGTTVPIGQPIAVIDSQPDAESGSAQQLPVVSADTTPPGQPGPIETPAPAATPVRATPLVRSLARQHGIDLNAVTGSGPGGRIVRADIDAVIAQHSAAAVPSTPSPPTAIPQRPPIGTAGAADDERVPLSRIRRITAARLTESAAVPHFYLTSVADADALQKLRTDLNAEVRGSGLKISVTDLVLRACAITLWAHPQINASWAGDHLLRHAHVNIGCAVATDKGLLVPVIRDANLKSLTDITVEMHAAVERARTGKLTPDELTGGTFTISNLGMYGIDHFTAVINPPEAAVLAVGAVQQEAVVRDGQLTAARTLKLTLSIDHRILDGAAGAEFLQDLVELIEHPLRIVV